jgi:5-methylcytosine-specific restriction endonuclease McrA
MPIAPSARCRGCHRLQDRPGLCSACRAGDPGRGKRIYNSKAWALLRDQVLSEEPVCRHCRRGGFLEVDHIVPVLVAPRLALVRSNLQALCPPCHATKTRNESRG